MKNDRILSFSNSLKLLDEDARAFSGTENYALLVKPDVSMKPRCDANELLQNILETVLVIESGLQKVSRRSDQVMDQTILVGAWIC